MPDFKDTKAIDAELRAKGIGYLDPMTTDSTQPAPRERPSAGLAGLVAHGSMSEKIATLEASLRELRLRESTKDHHARNELERIGVTADEQWVLVNTRAESAEAELARCKEQLEAERSRK